MFSTESTCLGWKKVQRILQKIPNCLPSKKMFSKVFFAHGEFCASHPWEVFIGILSITISLISMSFGSTNRKVCGWNYICHYEEQKWMVSEILFLSLIRCLAIVYIYMQFKSLRKLGSKYLLGLAGLFTIFSSFTFSVGFANLVGVDLVGLGEALPFFLLLIDLSKANALTRLTLAALSQDDLHKNIGRAMAVIGPTLTLDAIVETLAIGIGTKSGVRHLESMCYFGCLSVTTNYIAFITFYPACLSLVLEILRSCNHGKPLSQLQQLATIWQKEEEQKRSNPVTIRVKIIMSAGLALVHAHSRFISDNISSRVDNVSALEYVEDHWITPDIPLWQFYISRCLTTRFDHGLAIALAIGLTIKYIVFDDKLEEVQEQLKAKNYSDQVEFLKDRKQKKVVTIPEMPAFAKFEQRGNSFAKAQFNSPNEESVHTASFIVGNDNSSSNSEDEDSNEGTENVCNKTTQTDDIVHNGFAGPSRRLSEDLIYNPSASDQPPRPLKECVSILNSDAGTEELTDAEIELLVESRHIPSYKLEGMLGNHMRGVAIRRRMLSKNLQYASALDALPFMHYDYKYVEGACCENVIGYMPVPVGVAGPMLLDGAKYHVPMATTEGCLVASVNRGCRALLQSGGVTSSVINDGMTRGPVVRFPTAFRASEAKKWMETTDNFDLIKEGFDATSRFARLKSLKTAQAGRSLYIRFVAGTGDAMGMNMLSKGSEKALNVLLEHFPDLEIISLSGNYCTDKKPAAINWIEGRGKSVVCEAIVKSNVIKNVMKTTVAALVELNISKNLVGSAMAGSIGGFNAHASNIVTAIYIAAGQDPAQNIASSNCIVLMEPAGPALEDLHISCTMPSIEVGTVGGGTVLPPQAACLSMLGVKGANFEEPGQNARRLAQVVCATVMAGELSLMSALAAGHLVKSHMKHNRSTLTILANATKQAENKEIQESVVAPSGCTGNAS